MNDSGDTMKCPSCSAPRVAVTDLFCSQCGKPLPECGEASLPEAHMQTDSGPVGVAEAGAEPSQQQEGATAQVAAYEVPAPVDGAESHCPDCSSANRPGARFCLACGHPLLPQSPAVAPEASNAPFACPEQEGFEGAAALEEASAAQVSPAVESALCGSCGAGNRPGAQFCKRCGLALTAAASTAYSAPTSSARDVGPSPAPDTVAPALAEPFLPALPDGDPEATNIRLNAVYGDPGPLEGRLEAAEDASPAQAVAAPVGDVAVDGDLQPDTVAEGDHLPPPPLEVNAIVAHRYAVLETLPATDKGTNRYAVADLQQCWSCEQEVVDPSQAFCIECGAAIGEPPSDRRLHLAEARVPGDGNALPEGVIVEGERLYVLVPRKAEPVLTSFAKGMRLEGGQASDPGQVRDLDEDSVFALNLTGLYEGHSSPTIGLYIVADGIGGAEGGEWASRIATQTIAGELLSCLVLPLLTGDVGLPLLEEAVHDHIRRAVATANQRILQVRTARGSDMGTTVTLALVLDTLAYIANVGDSRTYLWEKDGLEQVTTDHSLIARLIASGMAEPAEIYTHPQRSAIYRSLGDKPSIEVDMFTRSLSPGNMLLLCCDGLWEMVHDEGLEDLLLQGLPPQAVCDEAVRRANLAGGEDNISVVVVRAY